VAGNFVFTGSDDASIRIWNMSGEVHPKPRVYSLF
jgi:hypothetical protein